MTASARRSPRARGAQPFRARHNDPRCDPHVEYFLSTAAFSFATARPASSSSALSRPKNTGLSGESRFRSSSERLRIESSASRGVTGAASSTRCGGGGGGATTDGCSTGGVAAVRSPLFPQPVVAVSATRDRDHERGVSDVSHCHPLVTSLSSTTRASDCCHRA